MSYTDSPTDKQLDFIENLAQKTGETIVKPRDRRAASREIERLLGLKAAQQENAEALAS
jgi:hypothetical protein